VNFKSTQKPQVLVYIKLFNKGKKVAHWWVLCLHYKLYSFCFGLDLDLGAMALWYEAVALRSWPWPWAHGLGLGLDGAGLVNITG